MPCSATCPIVLSWDGEAGLLRLQVEREIGGETGLLSFYGVSQVNLPPSLGIGGIECGSLQDLPKQFLETYRPSDQGLDPHEVAYLIHGSWGEEFFVIAEWIEYTIRVDK